MGKRRISKSTVDATHHAAKDIFVWDDSLPGFGVKITPSGHKSYVVQYRPGAGGRRRVVRGAVAQLAQHLTVR